MLVTKRAHLFVFVILATFLASLLHGQITTGSILGVIADDSGARMPGATVTVINVDTGSIRTVVSDAGGRYRAANLGLGNYEIKAEAQGFRTAIRRGIQLSVGSETVVDLTLSVGTVAEQVEVTAEAALIETTNATVSGVVNDRQVRDLPLNGRSFENLIFLQSGVVPFLQGAQGTEQGEGTKLAMSGSRIDSNNFLLDGANMNDQSNMTPGSAAGKLLGVEILREFRVLTSNYSAEYGRVSGGIVNAVTKSGGNDLHGDVFEYVRNSAFDARNFFDRQTSPSEPRLPAFKRNQFGGTVGGHLIKDRTFYFLGYEAIRERLGATLLTFVPSLEARQGVIRDAAGNPQDVRINPAVQPYLDRFALPNGPALRSATGALTSTAPFLSSPSQPTRDDFGNIRIDHQFSSNHSFFGRYTIDDSERIFALPNRVTTPNTSRNQYGTLSETSILSSTVVNLARVAVARSFSSAFSQLLYDAPQSLWFFPDQGQLGVVNFRSGGLSPFGTVLGIPQRWAHETWTVTDDLTLTRGRQTLKVGFLLDRIRENMFKPRVVGGQFFFANLGGFLQGNPSEIQFQPPGNDPVRGARQFLFGAYLEDDIQLKPNLTVNLGIRYERATVPIEVNGKLANYPDPLHDVASAPHLGDPWYHGSTKDFMPRVGLAWDPFSKGKTSVRAGFGLYYDHIIASPYNRVFSFVFPFAQLVNFLSTNVPLTFPRLDPALLRAPNPLNMVSFSLAGDLPDPVKVSWTFGLQQEVARNLVVTATYVGAHSYHQTVGSNGNPAVESFDPARSRNFVPQPARFRNLNMGQVQTFYRNIGNSFYQGLQVNVQRRMTKGFQGQLSYTWSKTMSEADGPLGRFLNGEGRTGATSYVQDPDNLRGDRSLALTHFPHAAMINLSYELPFARQLKGFSGKMLSGWAVNSVITATTGDPMQLILGFDRTFSRVSGGGLSDRPDLKPGGNNNPVLGGPDHYYDPTQFVVPPVGFFGNLARMSAYAPGMVTADLSLVKSTSLRFPSESAHLQFRAELFNLLNRANFAVPFNQPLTPSGAPDARAGVIDQTITSSRQIQFALKLVF